MTDQIPAALLRRAAARLRQHSTAPGITPPPWASLDGGDRLLHDGPGAEDQPPQYVVDEPMSNGANADYIALVDPAVGRALPLLLERIASNAIEQDHEHLDGPGTCGPDTCDVLAALTVAAALLGEVTR